MYVNPVIIFLDDLPLKIIQKKLGLLLLHAIVIFLCCPTSDQSSGGVVPSTKIKVCQSVKKNSITSITAFSGFVEKCLAFLFRND